MMKTHDNLTPPLYPVKNITPSEILDKAFSYGGLSSAESKRDFLNKCYHLYQTMPYLPAENKTFITFDVFVSRMKLRLQQFINWQTIFVYMPPQTQFFIKLAKELAEDCFTWENKTYVGYIANRGRKHT